MSYEVLMITIQVVALASGWTNCTFRCETVRSALDCLAIVTITTKAQLQLKERIQLPDEQLDESGIRYNITCVFHSTSLIVLRNMLLVLVHCIE